MLFEILIVLMFSVMFAFSLIQRIEIRDLKWIMKQILEKEGQEFTEYSKEPDSSEKVSDAKEKVDDK